MRLLILALALAACGAQGTEPALGESIELRIGAAVTIPGDSVRVRFTDVTSDSRCPSNVQCVWAGEAVTVFTIGATEQVTLTLGADAKKATVIARGRQITLVALKPYPISTATTAKSDYIATIRITSAAD
ncbi:MAG: hypothetical protein FJ363_01650 [Gemmatimonadetes bacterium]|nr:hypothetical protein [Gemmatimonadota bacterium]